MSETRQRREILKILDTRGKHMTVERVFEETQKNFPHIAIGTVYRNLNKLADNGEIRRLFFHGDPVRFDRNTAPHQHKYCVKCHSVADIEDIDKATISELTGSCAEIVDYDFCVYIVCENCAGGKE
ncbi:MAG: transcriptional repressor [Oscillospiraceae bacterium]|jgi:Fe2+ or Zn2+ uptake regulation protein|nr:transcriptional repressor [Oscillospiraceae bacterium]